MNASIVFAAVAGVFAASFSSADAFLLNGTEVMEDGPTSILFAGDAFMSIGARVSNEILEQFNTARDDKTKPVHELFEAIETKSDILYERPGDLSATAALVYSKLGGQVGFIGIVGDDDMGDKFNDYMGDNDVEVRTIRRGGNYTSRLYSLVDENGSYNVFKAVGACDTVSAADVDPFLMDYYDFFAVTTDMLRTAGRTGFTAKMVDAAINRGQKIITILTDVVFGDYDSEMLKVILHNSEYVVGSMEQFIAIYKVSSRDEVADILHEKTSGDEPDHEVMLVTLGAEGFALFYDSEYIYVPAPEVAVQRADADDYFIGAMLYGMLNGRKLAETIQYARAVVTDVCSDISAPLSDNFYNLITDIPRI
ncbi:Ribokinase like superfamily protein, putative [Babesia bigemina]|uniref:Ribokinase like superfamily protein, putative n=1 Tax=Babesia bigemina TaxID=5866 RepID=A0A061D7M9_BABBI|nr:Ribokinase like superfamily protein, putative [Babesia bigemina]CDR93725.1 Ribokinase like superfamily protein, putative [Babesia bigemina]|eukprot:XP_012765911.1 Ribokinase like superfamily protein, putative [Babesia bigemina]